MSFGYESIKLSPTTPSQSEPPSPLVSFTQQLQAIQNQVQTDKMVESVTAAIFNSDDNASQIYPPILPMASMDPMRQLISAKTQMDPLQQDMKVLNPELMITDTAMQSNVMQPEQRMMVYNTARPEEAFNPFGAMTKMEMETNQIERRLARQSAHMDALVEDAMKVSLILLYLTG